MRCRDLRDCSEDEIVDELRNQGVTAAKRFTVNQNGMKEATNTVVLTFRSPQPPSEVIVATYLKVAVEPFIPMPLRCFKCQQFGHGQSTCRRPAVCARCGAEGHAEAECGHQPHCLNCAGDHPAYSRDCAEWHRQREISRIKCTRGISFAEARKLVSPPNAGGAGSTASYASVAAPVMRRQTAPRRETGTQTDITWPNSSAAPVALSVACQTDDILPVDVLSRSDSATLSVPSAMSKNSTTVPESAAVVSTSGRVAAAASAPTAVAAPSGVILPAPPASALAAADQPGKGTYRPGPASSKPNAPRATGPKQQQQQQHNRARREEQKPQQQQQQHTLQAKVGVGRIETTNTFGVLAENAADGMEVDAPHPPAKKS